jgi:RNA polymerase sigma factor (sigma-70 family)
VYPDNEEQLVNQSRRGDIAALNMLLRRIEPDVLRLCHRYLYHQQDAEEACQDVLLAVSTNIIRFEGRSDFRTWVHAIASNCALDTYRRLKRRADEQPTHPLPTVTEVRTTSVIVGTRIDLLEALEKLEKDKPELLKPVLLRELGQLRYAEIAAHLSLPIDTVKTQIRRGRLHLRKTLATRHQ